MNPSSLVISVKREISEALKKLGFNVNSNIELLIFSVEDFLSESIKGKIGLPHEVKATIIYEIITSDI